MGVLEDFDSFWDFDDPATSEIRFREVLAEKDSLSSDEHIQLLTQIARCQGMQRNFDDAHDTLDGAQQLLNDHTHVARVRYLLERGRMFNSSGDLDRARPLFLEAWESSQAAGFDFHAIDAAHMMGIIESAQETLNWNERGLELARRTHDPNCQKWIGSIANNIGWTHFQSGAYVLALEYFESALAARRRQGDENLIRIARWCIARTYRALDRNEEALCIQRELDQENRVAGKTDGFIEEELAECLLAMGQIQEAKRHFQCAAELLAADSSLVEHEPDRLARLHRLAKCETDDPIE